MSKRIQISRELYDLMVLYIKNHYDPGDIERYKKIVKGIDDKQEAATRHNAYTAYKTDKDPEMREMARQVYLDHVGMRQSFRWSKGNSPFD